MLDEMTLSKIFINFPKKIFDNTNPRSFYGLQVLSSETPSTCTFFQTLQQLRGFRSHIFSSEIKYYICKYKKSFINKNIKSFKSSKDPAKELLFIT